MNCKLCHSHQPNLKPTLCRSRCGKWVLENSFHYLNERNYKVNLNTVLTKSLCDCECALWDVHLFIISFFSHLFVHVLCSCPILSRLTACCGMLHKDRQLISYSSFLSPGESWSHVWPSVSLRCKRHGLSIRCWRRALTPHLTYRHSSDNLSPFWCIFKIEREGRDTARE